MTEVLVVVQYGGMKESERKQVLRGILVFSVLVIIAFSILLADRWGLFRGEYIVLTFFEKAKGIEKGSVVFMDGQKVGAVSRVRVSTDPPGISVKIRVKRETFRRIGPDSIAWVVAGEPSHIELRPDKPRKGFDLLRITFVKGLDAEPETKER